MKQLALLQTDDAAARIGRAVFAAILEMRKGNPAFRLTEESLVAALRSPLTKELPKAKRVNGRNVLFDALAAGCGIEAPFTKSRAGQVAKALRDVLEICPNVTAEELNATAKAIRRKYEGAGPMAVAIHWDEFASARRTRHTSSQPTAPAGWLAKLNEMFPDSTLARGGRFEVTKETDYAFSQLDPTLRTALTKALS